MKRARSEGGEAARGCNWEREVARARDVHNRILEAFSKHDLAALTNSKNWIPRLPDPVSPKFDYCYMGRQVTGDVRNFILFMGHLADFEDLREDKSEIFHLYGERVFGFVSGVPGYGKSTSLKTAFGNLYYSFLPNVLAKKRLEKFAYDMLHKVEDKQRAGELEPADVKKIEGAVKDAIEWLHSDEASTVHPLEAKQKELESVCNPVMARISQGAGAPSSVSAPRRRKRIMYINCKKLVSAPSGTIVRSLLLSHFDMVQAEDPELMALVQHPDLSDALRFLIRGRKENEVYILVDDANVLDLGDDERCIESRRLKFTLEQRREGWGVLQELREFCAIVLCASVSSWLLKYCGTDKSSPLKFYSGGFTMSERADYLLHRNMVLSSHDEDVAGCVPRFLGYLDSPEQLEEAYNWYREGIQAFVEKHIGKLDEVYRTFSGMEEVPKGFDGLSTRCFYRGANGRAECLTNHLKSYALGCLAEQMKRQASIDGEQEVLRWLSTVRDDTNICRIGWNAEAAAITALCLLDVTIRLPLSSEPPKPAQNQASEMPMQILKELSKDGDICYFSKPVHKLSKEVSLVDYLEKVDKPMDLETVTRRLRSGKYVSGQAFADDVKLVFDNAVKYNEKGYVFEAAKRMKDKFEELWNKGQAEVSQQGTLELKPDVVRRFSGQFSLVPRGGKKVLSIPNAFNHMGADVYYEDEKIIVIIHVSVRVNAKKFHHRTVELLLRTIPADDTRRRIVLWVLGGVVCAYEKFGDYEDIEIPFGTLHHILKPVDSRCASLRGMPGQECLYCCATECALAGRRLDWDDWIQCDECEMWVHQLCTDHARLDDSFTCCYCRKYLSEVR